MSKPIITVGALTTHGGMVVSGSSASVINGIPIARVGDSVICPLKGHIGIKIATGDPSFIVDGKPVARQGDKTTCGASLIAIQRLCSVVPGGSGIKSSAAAPLLDLSEPEDTFMQLLKGVNPEFSCIPPELLNNIDNPQKAITQSLTSYAHNALGNIEKQAMEKLRGTQIGDMWAQAKDIHQTINETKAKIDEVKRNIETLKNFADQAIKDPKGLVQDLITQHVNGQIDLSKAQGSCGFPSIDDIITAGQVRVTDILGLSSINPNDLLQSDLLQSITATDTDVIDDELQAELDDPESLQAATYRSGNWMGDGSGRNNMPASGQIQQRDGSWQDFETPSRGGYHQSDNAERYVRNRSELDHDYQAFPPHTERVSLADGEPLYEETPSQRTARAADKVADGMSETGEFIGDNPDLLIPGMGVVGVAGKGIKAANNADKVVDAGKAAAATKGLKKDKHGRTHGDDGRYMSEPDKIKVDNIYSRPSGYRAGVRDKAWENAREQSTGQVRDPRTGKFMSKDDPWDMGHKPKHEHHKHQKSAQERGISREEFLDEHNNPNIYRPELPSSNRSRKGEDTTDIFLGP